MSKKTLYMHIGTPKTGTTAIQHFLRKNHDLFKENNFQVYSAQDDIKERNLRFLVTYLDIFGQLELINKGLLPEDKSSHKKILDEWYTNFLADIKQSVCDNILLSEEMLWWAVCDKEKMSKLLNDLKNDFKIKFIVYLRRQDYYLMSMYQQTLKAGRGDGMSCSKWIEAPSNPQKSLYTHYDEHLKWLAETFGKENLIIRIYEKEQLKGQSIFDDFMSSIGLDLSDKLILSKRNINKGLSPFATELARNFSKNNSERISFMSFISGYRPVSLFNDLVEQHNFLSPIDRHKLLSQYENGNKYISLELLDRKDGALFYEPLQNPDDKWIQYKLPFDDALSFLFTTVSKQNTEIQRLNNIISEQDKKYKNIKFLYNKLPLFLKYPVRKTWDTCKFVKRELSGESK